MSINYYRKRSNSSIFDIMDHIFNDAIDTAFGSYGTQPSRHNKLISTSSFPPTNILVDQKTKVMTIETALAGIHEDWINLSFDGDYLKLIIDSPNKVDDQKEDSNNYYFQLGLKKVEHLETSWSVDPRFYSRDNVEVDFTNGLLTIKIHPKEDVKPSQKRLFGNLEANKQIESS